LFPVSLSSADRCFTDSAFSFSIQSNVDFPETGSIGNNEKVFTGLELHLVDLKPMGQESEQNKLKIRTDLIRLGQA
jgi:hypothetical protein